MIPAYSSAAACKPLYLQSFDWFVCSHVLCLVGLLGNAGLSDARLRRPKPKLLYPDHRLPPRFTEVTTPAIARTMVRGRLPICQF